MPDILGETPSQRGYPDGAELLMMQIGPEFGFAPVKRKLCLLAMVFHCPFQNVRGCFLRHEVSHRSPVNRTNLSEVVSYPGPGFCTGELDLGPRVNCQ